MEVSRLTLERWALGDLPDGERASLEAELAQDAELAAHAQRVKASVLAAANDLPAAPTWAGADDGAPAGGVVIEGPWGARRIGLFVAAAAALLALGLGLRPPPASPPDVAFRGALDLQVQLVRGGNASEQGMLITAQAGDRLQYRVTPGQAGWISVFDLQDDGVLSTWTAPREVYAKQTVEGAVVLDDYAGSERVFFVFAAEPIDEAAAKVALESAFDTPLATLEGLPGLAGTTQRSLLLVK